MGEGILSFGHGEIRLGGKLLPGVLKRQSIASWVRFDDAEEEGLSGTTKKVMRWEDGDIWFEMALLSDFDTDCYEKLSRIHKIFKAADIGQNPRVYDVVNAHAAARGIDRVIFSGLDSTETDKDDVIKATLSFREHNPPVRDREERAVASDKARGEKAPGTTEKEPEPDEEIQKDPGPFLAGLEAGGA